jgi:ribosomal protein L12E/L44/L45/RPP1/RPP2
LTKGVPASAGDKAAVPGPAAAGGSAKDAFKPDGKALGYLNKLEEKEKKQAEKVSGGGSRPVNINISLQALNQGGITVNSATVEGAVSDLEGKFMDMMLRIVNGANNMALG